MWASFLWKCICHMLYQLGILTILESIGHSVLPSVISGASKKDQRDFSAYLSMEAYKKLHEVALKGKNINFQDTLNPFCSCGLDVETNMNFFLYCHLLTNERRTLLSTVKDIDSSLKNTNDSKLTHNLLFGKASLDTSASTLLLNATMNYIISTNRFEESLF